MKLSQIETAKLLPRFARNDFTMAACHALDAVFRAMNTRIEALPLEASIHAISLCRNDELAQLAGDLCVLPYYPDLERSVRENLILNAGLWTRRAGTPLSVTAMVNTVFSTDSTTMFESDDPSSFRYTIMVDEDIVSNETTHTRLHYCLRTVSHATTTPVIQVNYKVTVKEPIHISSSPVIYEMEAYL